MARSYRSDFVIERSKLVELVAAACHEVNRAWCLAHGDESQVHWSMAPAWQRDSAIAGVEHAMVDPRPEASHESWMKQKIADGWTYGKTKDPDRKTHPCLVPFGDLPPEQQKKDALFTSTVIELGTMLGLVGVVKNRGT